VVRYAATGEEVDQQHGVYDGDSICNVKQADSIMTAICDAVLGHSARRVSDNPDRIEKFKKTHFVQIVSLTRL
jgi:hypothetical protein